MIEKNFWKNKKVFITGHTGFKGSWLCMWLKELGAEVYGYSLNPPTNPNLFDLCNLKDKVFSQINDIRDLEKLRKAMTEVEPEIVFHMAAQPLVRESYKNPVDTFSINILGTVNILESVRSCSSVRVIVNVTTDKCYENNEWLWGYRENDRLGGYDPYSNSKACSEFVTASYRNAFFNPENYETHRVGIASARAGNVIGGGDWAMERLIPDCVKSILKRELIIIRNPRAIRPWQHVLEPLSGYLLLAQNLFDKGPEFVGGWNFGPDDCDAKSVEWIVSSLCSKWGPEAEYKINSNHTLHEATFLKLDCSKAKSLLKWHPRWHINKAIDKTIEWVKAYKDERDLRVICLQQIEEYINS